MILDFSSVNLKRIWEVGRWWGDEKVIGCLTETTTCVVAKPLVSISLIIASGFATTHVLVSVRHPITY